MFGRQARTDFKECLSIPCGQLIEDPGPGLALLEEALLLWQGMGRPADLAAALLDLADLACAAGSPIERALIAARGALQLARQHGFRALEAAALLALAETYQRGGRLEPAAVSAAEAQRACRETDDLLVHQRWARWEAAGRRDEGTGGREARETAPCCCVSSTSRRGKSSFAVRRDTCGSSVPQKQCSVLCSASAIAHSRQRAYTGLKQSSPGR